MKSDPSFSFLLIFLYVIIYGITKPVSIYITEVILIFESQVVKKNVMQLQSKVPEKHWFQVANKK